MSTTDVTVLLPQQTAGPNSLTQHSLSRAEIVHGVANRIIYSRFYSWLYLGMALLSTIPIILSLIEECQTLGFVILEVIINTVMIAEVATRFLALGKLFWKSVFNIVDIVLVFLCVTTLIFVLKGGCSHKGEEVFDLILLIARNLIQFGRIIVMLRKNKKNRKARSATVNFDNIRESSASMDVDSLSNRAFLITDEEDDFL